MNLAVSTFPLNLAAAELDRFEPAADSLPEIPKALFLLDAASRDLIYAPQDRRRLEDLADFYAPAQTRESIARNPALLADADVIFSGWGAPVMDEAFLQAAPNLRAVFYGAGSIGYCTTDAFWDRDILITSAYAANARVMSTVNQMYQTLLQAM